MSLRCTHPGALQAYPGQTAQTMMYQLEVPSGVGTGQQFQAQVGDRMMVITCPAGAGPGSTIQVHYSSPATAPPISRSCSLPPTLLSILTRRRLARAGCGPLGHCHRRALSSPTDGDRRARGCVRS